MKLQTLSLICLSFLAVRGAEAQRETYAQKILHLAYDIEVDPVLKSLWSKSQFADYNSGLPDVRFECDIELSPTPPTSAHTLRPGDIGVIAAVGDSITAGNGLGATTPASVSIENRGESFSIGGDEEFEKDVITLTNILRFYNPEIRGFSHCSSNTRNEDRSWLNLAEMDAVSGTLLEQVDEIIRRMSNDSRIDFDLDWKLFSLLIGQNDLCASCDGSGQYTPEVFGANVRTAVYRLFEDVPRVFVNIIPTFDVTPTANYSSGDQTCERYQARYCECAVNQTTNDDLRDTQLGYYDELKALTDDLIFTQRDDFALVLQPFLVDFLPIDADTGAPINGFLAPDCFHLSKLGHQSFAFWLWNSMLTPVASKPLTSTADYVTGPNILFCPSAANPYFFTNRNSGI